MPNRALLWIASLVSLIAFILALVAIILIRRTWADPQRREYGMVSLYIATGAIFLVALMIALAAEITPNMCQLPYSGSLVQIK